MYIQKWVKEGSKMVALRVADFPNEYVYTHTDTFDYRIVQQEVLVFKSTNIQDPDFHGWCQVNWHQ